MGDTCSFQKSLKDAVNQEISGESPLCEGSQPKTECTTASLEILKNCLNGIKVDAMCLKDVHQDLSEDKECFCGGLVNFSRMLAAIEALLCSEDQERVSKLAFADLEALFKPTTTTAATTTTTATTSTTRGGKLFFPKPATTTTAATTTTVAATTAATTTAAAT